MEYEADSTIPGNEGIGIDLGIKELAVCSDQTRYPNINKTRKVKKLEKRKRRLQRSISRKYEKNKKGECYWKTSNLIKREQELLKISQRLTNIRRNHLHPVTCAIIKRKPSFICMEDLNVPELVSSICFFAVQKHTQRSRNETEKLTTFYKFSVTDVR